MSKFAVEVREVDYVQNHPNADKLDIVTLAGLGFQFITGRDNFKVGDQAIYFPIDSVLPEELVARLGLPKNRIRSMKLRGVVSEGFLTRVEELYPNTIITVGYNLTDDLSVIKYEPPYNGSNNMRFGKQEDLYPIPVYVYDLENAQNYPNVIAALQEVEVVVTEKLEGSNWWARISKDNLLTTEGHDQLIEVGQRRFGIKQMKKEGEALHPWWKAFYDQNLDVFLDKLSREFPGYDITIRGEMVGQGVQGNIYGMKDRSVRLFEIELNDRPIAAGSFIALCNRFDAVTVPILTIDYMRNVARTAQELTAYSNGTSKLADRLREGVVIRPLEQEMRDYELGRVIIKARDPIYLSKGE